MASAESTAPFTRGVLIMCIMAGLVGCSTAGRTLQQSCPVCGNRATAAATCAALPAATRNGIVDEVVNSCSGTGGIGRMPACCALQSLPAWSQIEACICGRSIPSLTSSVNELAVFSACGCGGATSSATASASSVASSAVSSNSFATSDSGASPGNALGEAANSSTLSFLAPANQSTTMVTPQDVLNSIVFPELGSGGVPAG